LTDSRFRAIVPHGKGKAMNVTLKLPDHLVRDARHLALDEKKSLSALVADLLVQRLGKASEADRGPKSLLEAMTVPGMPDWFYEKEFPLEDRGTWTAREVSFDPDEA
jgi:hypothetical protein